MRVSFASLALVALALLPSAFADFTVITDLVAPELQMDARAIDAHDDIAYVVGDGVVGVDVTTPSKPRVIATVSDWLLRGCSSVCAYASPSGARRIAVACEDSDSLAILDASDPTGGLVLLGGVSEPVTLRGAASVVVSGSLAFVAARGASRVVSVDLSDESNPRVLSHVKLSGADSITLAPDSHVAVAVGGKHGGGGRVSLLSYVPSGVLMKAGSVKDGRLEGEASVAVRPFNGDPNVLLAVSAANGGSLVVVNATSKAAPSVAVALQAAGRESAAPSPDGFEPNGHKSLAGAAGLCVAGNGVAYVAAARRERGERDRSARRRRGQTETRADRLGPEARGRGGPVRRGRAREGAGGGGEAARRRRDALRRRPGDGGDAARRTQRRGGNRRGDDGKRRGAVSGEG